MQKIMNNSSYIDQMYFRYVNICGPHNTGKTGFLSEMTSHFRMKGHPVIRLDFSDCCIMTYEEAIYYIKSKMSGLYCEMYDRCKRDFQGYRSCEKYIDVLEGSCDTETLSGSLLNMVYSLRRSNQGNRKSNRPMIFIDEISRPLLYSAEYGFYEELQRFYDEFLEIDHYELTGGIYTTSFAPVNTDVEYSLKYISNVPINDIEPIAAHCLDSGIDLNMDFKKIIIWTGTRYFDVQISLLECYKRFSEEVEEERMRSKITAIELDVGIRYEIYKKRKWISNKKKAEEECERIKQQRSICEYAASLPKGCNIPSKFAGVRNLQIEIKNFEKYDQLNYILTDLYMRYGGEISLSNVYDYIQSLERNADYGDRIDKTLYSLKVAADSKNTFFECSVDSKSTSWGRFDLQVKEHESGFSDMALVKVYLSLLDHGKIIRVFEETVVFLIEHCKHRFHAKVALDNRRDQICLWVSREDFFQLEGFLQKYNKDLYTALPFVAYRNNIGISREFWSWDSHNGVQAALITSYLKQVKDAETIDVVDMYAKYVRAWNGDLKEDDLMTSEFKRSNAQEFIVLLDSLDVMLGNSEITDDHILLNGDDDLWYSLGHAKNWYEVGREIIGK